MTLPEASVVEVVCAVENVIVLPLTVRTSVGGGSATGYPRCQR